MDVREGRTPQLVQRERAIETQLNTLAASRMQLRSRTHTPEAARVARAGTSPASNRSASGVEIEVRQHAALVTRRWRIPQPLATRDIQQNLLDDDTLLLEFLLGEDRSYVWALSRSSLVSPELPKRTRGRGGGTNRSRPGRTDAVPATGLQDAARTPERDAAWAGRERAPGPAPGHRGRRGLAVRAVCDAAITAARAGATGSRAQRRFTTPLIVDHEIVTLPSASTLGIIRSRACEAHTRPQWDRGHR